nr:MAG TPA: tail tube protein [Caudoviricetes sp.]
MADTAIMKGKDAISGSLAKCFVTIEGKRFNFMQAINVKAEMEKNKVEVPILGKTGKGNKAAGWKGTGSATFHFNTSIFREVLQEYTKTGKDLYFDMQIVNEDPTASVDKQTIMLIDCNLDGGIIAQFDADADYLEDEFDFTFEDWKLVDKFKPLDGMNK